jgi:hypothetical protein
VLAQDNLGERSDIPVTATVNVRASKPAITAPAASTNSLRPTISCSGIDGADQYEVWINNLSTGASPFHTATVTAVSYVPTVDLGIGKFRVWVRAKSGTVFSMWSLERDFTIDT